MWKNVNGFFSDYYMISNKGRVRSVRRERIDSLGRKRSAYEKELKQSVDRYGYRYVIFRVGNKSRTHKVHRLVAETFLGKSKKQVNHIDLDKQNNNLSNLEYVTNSENLLHRRKFGSPYKKYFRKLSKKIYDDVRARHKSGESYTTIAKDYGIHPHSVYKILKS